MSVWAWPTVVRLTINATRWASMNHLTWLDVSQLEGGQHVVQWNAPFKLQKLHAIWSRQPVGGAPQDVAVTTHHFLNITDAAPDDTWTAADFASVEAKYQTMWTALKTLYPAIVKLVEFRWYPDGPAYKPHGGTSALVERVTPVGVVGTHASAMLPPQVAISVTEKTSGHYEVPAQHGHGIQIRNRWGRFYLPAPTVGGMGAAGGAAEGRVGAGTQTTIADAVQVFYNACRAADLFPVMYSPTLGSALSVDEIHVDDIYDVIRRRRFETPTSRAIRTLT